MPQARRHALALVTGFDVVMSHIGQTQRSKAPILARS